LRVRFAPQFKRCAGPISVPAGRTCSTRVTTKGITSIGRNPKRVSAACTLVALLPRATTITAVITIQVKTIKI
jgi:hypothetical protein